MARPPDPAKVTQLRAAFVNVGIPHEQADNALAQFPTAVANQQDVDRLLLSVGFPAGYGKVKDQPLATQLGWQEEED